MRGTQSIEVRDPIRDNDQSGHNHRLRTRASVSAASPYVPIIF